MEISFMTMTRDTHIVIFEVAQHFQFTVDTFTRDEVLKDIRHLFESHPFAISRICDSPETKISNIATVQHPVPWNRSIVQKK